MVDVLIAVFVTALLLMALTSLMIAARVSAKAATENNAAYNAARQVMENVRRYDGSPLTVRDYTNADVLRLGDVPQAADLAQPTITMTLATWQDPATGVVRPQMKLISVVVTWQTRGTVAATKTRTFVSLVTAKGVVR